MRSTDQLLLAILVSDNMNANQAAMTSLLETVRIPAQQGQQQNQPATVVPPPTQSAALVPETFRSSDNQVSLVLPGEGVVLDHIADQQVLAYGDSETAAQSRLYSAKPDLAPLTPLTGSGGLVILYPMERFGIDPQNPNLAPLMERALGNLTGYTVEQTAQPLAGGGVYAVISLYRRAWLSGADPVRRSNRLRDGDDHARRLRRQQRHPARHRQVGARARR